jgi:hypothetical protein
MSDIKVALVTITERGIEIGDEYPADSPVVQQNPAWFGDRTEVTPEREPEPVSGPPVVEAATAEPGEVREHGYSAP